MISSFKFLVINLSIYLAAVSEKNNTIQEEAIAKEWFNLIMSSKQIVNNSPKIEKIKSDFLDKKLKFIFSWIVYMIR